VRLVPLLIVAEQGRIWGWTSDKAWACYLIGARRHRLVPDRGVPAGDDALLPMRLFGGRTFSIGSALNFIIGMGMFRRDRRAAAVPADRQGKTPTEAGLLLLPLTIGIMAGSIISGADDLADRPVQGLPDRRGVPAAGRDAADEPAARGHHDPRRSSCTP
jgi:hypothetical protein